MGKLKSPLPAGGPDELLKPVEVARALNCSRSLVYQMMDAKELPYVQIRTTRRVRRSALDAYIRDNSIE